MKLLMDIFEIKTFFLTPNFDFLKIDAYINIYVRYADDKAPFKQILHNC